MDELDLRIRTHLYASFVRDGVAQTPEAAAAALGLEEERVQVAYRRLHDTHALVLHPGSNEIWMLNPFSTIETPYRVEAGGRAWYGNCAWDALGIPGALHGDAGRIESDCPDCGELLELEVRGGELVHGAELLVHILVPARHWWDDIGFT